MHPLAWLGIILAVLAGTIAAIGELVAGTCFDTIAERYATGSGLFPRDWRF